MIDGEHAFKSASTFGSRTDRARCPDQSLAEISRSELSKALRRETSRTWPNFGVWTHLPNFWAMGKFGRNLGGKSPFYMPK